MKQEDKDLLLQDLCGRLPYGVKCRYQHIQYVENGKIIDINMFGLVNVDGHIKDICDIKPYLFPLSNMTEGQTEEVHNLIYQGVAESIEETKEWLKTRKENELRPITLTYILSYTLVIDWFCKNHFDYRGLIPMGLAMDATNLNIY